MKNHFLQRILLSAGMLSLIASALTAKDLSPKLYGVTFFGNDLIAIDATTGAGSLVGSLDATVSGYGIAARYGRLYSFNPNTGLIVEISPATGKVKRTIDIGVHGLQGEGDLAFSTAGVGFLASALDVNANPVADLYTFDVIGATSKRIGSTGIVIDAMAFDSKNVLYALGQGEGKLYVINQSTGAASELGSLGIEMNSPFAAMTFSPTGVLYVAVDDRLFEVNKLTGAATPVNPEVVDVGFSSVSGIAFQIPDPGARLFGLTFFSNELFGIDPSTGEGTIIGSVGAAVSGYGIAERLGRLYTFNPNTDQILEISPVNGSVVRSISIGVGDVQGEGDLAFRNDGVGFLTSALSPLAAPVNDLYSFDLIAGTSTRIGSTGVTLDGLAFDSHGVLYGLGQGDGTLYTVNQTTAVTQAVGSLGIDMNSPFAGMTFGRDNKLYVAVDDRLYTVDTTTGAATPVDLSVLDFGFSSVSGLAFAPSIGQLSIAREGNDSVAVYWFGPGYTLETAGLVTGPWSKAENQSEPQRFSAADNQKYFRLRR